MDIPKLEKDNKVAVVYSPGYGAGWSTWNEEIAELLIFHKDIAQLVLDEKLDEVEAVAQKLILEYSEEEDPYHYLSTDKLKVEWVAKNYQFEIEEYDGYESIHIIGGRKYFTA